MTLEIYKVKNSAFLLEKNINFYIKMTKQKHRQIL